MNHSSRQTSIRTLTKGYVSRSAFFEYEDAVIEENGDDSSSFEAGSEDSSVYSLQIFNSDDSLISGITFVEVDGTISKIHATEYPCYQPLPEYVQENVVLVGLKEDSKKTLEKKRSKKKKKKSKNGRKHSSRFNQEKLIRPKSGKAPSTSERSGRTATTTKSDSSTLAMLSSRTLGAETATIVSVIQAYHDKDKTLNRKNKKRRSKLKNKKAKQMKEKIDVANEKKRKTESKKEKSKSRLLNNKEIGKKLEPPGKRMTDFQTLVEPKPCQLARCRVFLAKAA